MDLRKLRNGRITSVGKSEIYVYANNSLWCVDVNGMVESDKITGKKRISVMDSRGI